MTESLEIGYNSLKPPGIGPCPTVQERGLTGETDHELVAKSLQGNEKAFRGLIERYHSTAYAVVRGVLGDSDDVEDVLQMVYIKIHRGLAGFRGDAKLSTWIYQIARNEAINAVKKRRFDTSSIEDVTLAAPSSESPEAAMRKTDTGRHLEEAMERLDENQRMALELRYMGERSYDEIAEMMGIPLGTVKTHIHRGKAELKKIIARRAAGERSYEL
jgi:RNA polymerase sigma factor (sigma-70 family)